MGRSASQRRGNWAEQRALRLLRAAGWTLLVEVKGRTRCGPDGWGVGALHADKRRRLESSLQLWLQQHPEYQDCRWEWVCALVPLPPSRRPVRWLPWV